MQERTALVLSAGMMFGAYQAGVWRSLSGHFRPDVVIGSSSGALNAWAIAGGCSPEELESAWLDPMLATITRMRVPFPPWDGIFDSDQLSAFARQFHAAYSPRLETAVVVTELRRLRARLVWNREITWQHLAASCSLPGGFRPVACQGTYCVDGGFLGAMPLWAAGEARATRALAILSMPQLPSALGRTFMRGLRSLAHPPRMREGVDVITIAPSQAMGDLSDLTYWRRDNIQRWIELGRKDGAVLRDNKGLWPSSESTG
jgi:NTE family protein